MNYNVYTIAYFDKQLKRLVKKYPSLKSELIELIATISANPEMGIDLGNNCFKIRLAISSKGKGRSGGARVITYVTVQENLSFYYLSMTNRINQILATGTTSPS